MSDFFGVGTLASGLFNGTVNLANGIMSNAFSWHNNEQNIKAQKEINEQNINFAREMNQTNRQYALEDQARLEAREDNAIQRKAADMYEAGINPLLAAEGGGASATMAPQQSTSTMPELTAPQSDFRYTPVNFGEKFNPIEDILNIKKTQAELKKAGLESEGEELDNAQKMIELEYAEERIQQSIEESKQRGYSIEVTTQKAIQDTMLDLSAEQRAQVEHEVMKKQAELEQQIKRGEIELQKQQKNLAILEQAVRNGELNEQDERIKKARIDAQREAEELELKKQMGTAGIIADAVKGVIGINLFLHKKNDNERKAQKAQARKKKK